MVVKMMIGEIDMNDMGDMEVKVALVSMCNGE